MIDLDGYEALAVLAETETRVLVRARPAGGVDTVVVKLLRTEHPGAEDLARLRHEYSIAADLPAEGFVRPLRVERFGRRAGLVMEDTGGISLSSAIPPGGMDVGAFLRLAVSLAAALEQLHGADVIHRDVKPSNVIVDEAGTGARLADFGIATRLPRVQQEVAPSRLEGTLAYTSPEQTGRMNRSVDHRSDLYSLGVTYYQMLTGRLPFSAADALELVHCHLAVVPPPPAELRQAVPGVLSAIVMRLLAKEPEDRYQSAAGVVHDLGLAQRRWDAYGQVEPFTLGEADGGDRFEIPERLYGRTQETAQLVAALDEVAGGANVLVLLSGAAGIGKTALVGELSVPVAQRRAYLIAGKFDQFSGNVPYASVAEAFAGLVRQLLAESPERIAAWRARLSAALGGNAGVVAEVLPDLRLVLGDPPSAPALGSTETQNRFNLVFGAFVGVFARPEHPLVVFLDDLHWADPASLKLLATLLDDADLHHLLVVSAYRPAEVSESHPLTMTLAGLAPDRVRRIEVGPLSAAVVGALLEDTFHADPQDTGPLALFLHDRSGGNPFFLRQLLMSLVDDGLVRFEGGDWAWNLTAIRAHGLTDDVVGFMVTKLAGLPARTRETLRVAAVIGSRFDLGLLASVVGQPPADVALTLDPAIAAGLVLTLGEAHELLGAGLEGAKVTYRFLHDRVQQASHSTIATEALPDLHRVVGTLLRSALADDDGGIFEVVEHLNAGVRPVTDEERFDLAHLNLRAARRAKASSAYGSAAHHLVRARDYLPEGCWGQHYETSFEISQTLGQVLAAQNRVVEAETAFAVAVANARDDTDAGTALAVRAEALFSAGLIAEALAAARGGLLRLGVELGEADAWQNASTPAAFQRLLDPSVVEQLAGAPPGDQSTALLGRLFGTAVICAYFNGSPDFTLLVGLAVERMLLAGATPDFGVPVGYVAMEVARLGHVDLGIAYAELAATLVESSADPAARGGVTMLAWIYCLSWRYDQHRALETYRDCFWQCHNSGSMIYANYSIICEVYAGITAGRDLPALLEVVERSVDHGSRFAPQAVEAMGAFGDTTRRAMGLPLRAGDLDALVDKYEADSPIMAMLVLNEIVRSEALMGDYPAAWEHGRRGNAVAEAAGGMSTGPWFLHHNVGLGVAASRLAGEADNPESRATYLDEAIRSAERVRPFLRWQLAGYGSLLDAEISRARGDLDSAASHYLAAVDHASEKGYTLLEGWANELLGRLQHECGRRVALAHLREARDLFAACGAAAKVAQVEADFPDLVDRPRAAVFDDTRTTTDHGPSSFDLSTVVKASQAIAAEVTYDKVAERLVAISVENAGAQRGALVSPEAPGSDVPVSVIAYAARTATPVVLADATADPAFSADPYVAEHAPRSVLAMPIVRNETTLGVLYLENRLLPGVFTPERLALLRLLSTQMAISLENARLYAGLEADVADRTRELSATLTDLQAAQTQIVESEKLASLGGLVAGVAHEINTPVGIAVTAASHLAEQAAGFEATYRDGPLRRSALESFLETAGTSGELILTNLRRATDLVSSFKQVAVDQSSEARRTLGVRAYLSDIVASLGPTLKATPHTVEVTCDDDLAICTYPGALAQVATNLVVNSLTHAYPDGSAGKLRFDVTAAPGGIRVVYSDDGSGIPADVLPRVFEPFFTTRRADGGSGLGLHIVHNLVTGRLAGSIAVDSEPGCGTRFTLTVTDLRP